jgi:ecdysteroid 25-hydroxylase
MNFLIEGKDKTHDYYRAILRDHMETGLESQQHQHVAGAYQKEIVSRLSTVGEVGTFTEPQMLHALADLFGAGYDTTLATLRWVLLYLAINPEAQKRVQNELHDVAASKGELGVFLMFLGGDCHFPID